MLLGGPQQTRQVSILYVRCFLEVVLEFRVQLQWLVVALVLKFLVKLHRCVGWPRALLNWPVLMRMAAHAETHKVFRGSMAVLSRGLWRTF